MLNHPTHYVYKHLRADTGEIFYVGKGTFKNIKKPHYDRAFCKSHARNLHWKGITEKHGFIVEICSLHDTDKEAQECERKLISEIGRRDLTKGPLVNFTDGGDGACGVVASADLCRKRSVAAKRPRSDAWVRAIRVARKHGGNGGVVMKGNSLPLEWREKIAKGQCGPNNYMRGRTGKDHPNARRVIDQITGHLYHSVQETADALGYKMKTLYNWLSGHRKNPTQLRFA